jgi:hypothetical protein
VRKLPDIQKEEHLGHIGKIPHGTMIVLPCGHTTHYRFHQLTTIVI